MTELLYQIALLVVIVAGIMLIVLLWRANKVLTDFDDTSKIINRRVHDVDKLVSSLQDYTENTVETINKLTSVFTTVKNMFDKSKEKKEKKDE